MSITSNMLPSCEVSDIATRKTEVLGFLDHSSQSVLPIFLLINLEEITSGYWDNFETPSLKFLQKKMYEKTKFKPSTLFYVYLNNCKENFNCLLLTF